MGILDRTRLTIADAVQGGAAFLLAPTIVAPTVGYEVAGFVMERQVRTQWCWAAVGVSVDTLYNHAARLKQCDVASRVTNGKCCGPGCNLPNRLERALEVVGRLHVRLGAVAPEPDLWAEVAGQRPAGVLIRWKGGGGHFLAIVAVESISGRTLLHVDDPATGSRHSLLVDRLQTGYKGTGVWTDTYFTRQ